MTTDPLAPDHRAEIEAAISGLTLRDAFDATVERRGHARAMRWRQDGAWSELSWSELAGVVDAAAEGLSRLGLGPGDRIGLFLGPRPEHLIADLGAVTLGAAASTLYETFTDDQLSHVLDTIDPRVVVVDTVERYERLRRCWTAPAPLFVKVGDSTAGTVPWSDVTGPATGGGVVLPSPRHRPSPADDVAIAYTSGTTGSLKGVVHSHRSVLWHAESFRRLLAVGDDDSTVAYLPYAHATSRFVAYYLPLVTGAEIHFCPELTELREHLMEARPTIMVGVLQVWENLYRAILDAADALELGQVVRDAVEVERQRRRAEQFGLPSDPLESARFEEASGVCAAVLRQVGLDRCRFGASGAGHLALEVIEFFNALGLPLAEGWGQSELLSAATIAAPGDIRPGTVGPALPGVEVCSDDDGQLLVRTGSRMSGYVGRRNGAVPTEDGWVGTGDYGTVEADGHVRVHGREGEFVVAENGTVVSFGRIESLLKTASSVVGACVVGGGVGSISVLLNVAGPTDRNELAEVVSFANEHLDKGEQIGAFAAVEGPWLPGRSAELTHTGKLRRAAIADIHRSVIADMG